MTRQADMFGRPLRSSEIGMRGEISRRWSKITFKEIVDLQSIDGLVTLVEKKYYLSRQAARSEVDAFVNGRRL